MTRKKEGQTETTASGEIDEWDWSERERERRAESERPKGWKGKGLKENSSRG